MCTLKQPEKKEHSPDLKWGKTGQKIKRKNFER